MFDRISDENVIISDRQSEVDYGSTRRMTLAGIAAFSLFPGLATANANPPNFPQLKASYPQADRDNFFLELGGDWPLLINDDNYANTCAIRMSVALHGAGVRIPDGKRDGITGDGRNLIFSIGKMDRYLNELLGAPSWGLSKEPDDPVQLPARAGIILYHADFSNATGHVDLWTGSDFVGQLDVWQGIDLPHDADMTDINSAAFQVGMWFLD